MIAKLTGILDSLEMARCIIDVNGVGYDVQIPLSTYDKMPRIGDKVSLLIETQVREDAITLFGFSTAEEKKLFLLLLGVSGIGGKLALNVLSAMPVGNFANAVGNGDLKALGRISGIGKRTAERLIVELRGKLGDLALPGSGGALPAGAGADAAAALEQLGFKREAVEKTIQSLIATLPAEELTSETLLRKALILLNS